MAQLDDIDFIAVRIQGERGSRTLHFNAWQDRATSKPAAF